MNKTNRSRAFFAWALAALGLVLLARGRYGFCWSDESFYLTFAQRMWNGQQLILDEWHPVQFYSALFYPVLSVYHSLFGTEGIYLFARVLYTLLALGASLLLYFTLCKKEQPLVSFLCAGLVLSYSRGNIWGLSYYNLFVLLCVSGWCMLLRGQGSRGGTRKTFFLLIGVFLSGAVLCVPYFALFVIPGVIAALLYRPGREAGRWSLLGICIAAALFILAFLPRDIAGMIANLKQIFTDPEHVGGPIVNLLAAIRDVKLLYYYEAGLVLLSCLVLLLGAKFLPESFGTLPGLLIALAGAAVSFWRYRLAETGFAAYTFALFCLPGLTLCWLRRQISIQALSLRLLGAAMGISMALSSNTEAIAFTVALPVYAMGVVLQFAFLPDTQKHLRRFSIILVCVTLGVTMYSRLTSVFRDGPIDTLTVTMTEGPAKGIRTTALHARQYEEILDMASDLNGTYTADNTVFFTNILPWGYLTVDFPCGVPTAWRTPLDSPRLESYGETHDLPDIVVVLHPEIGDHSTNAFPNENHRSGWLWEQMLQKQYQHLEYPCADVYVSPEADRKE